MLWLFVVYIMNITCFFFFVFFFSRIFAILKLCTFSRNVSYNVALCFLALRTLKNRKNTFPILNVIRTRRKKKQTLLCVIINTWGLNKWQKLKLGPGTWFSGSGIRKIIYHKYSARRLVQPSFHLIRSWTIYPEPILDRYIISDYHEKFLFTYIAEDDSEVLVTALYLIYMLGGLEPRLYYTWPEWRAWMKFWQVLKRSNIQTN